jgi:hypothetical protein
MTGKLTITCEDWRALRRNTLQGFATVLIVELGLKIHDVALHRRGDRTWAALPARAWIRDSTVVTGDDGKIVYSPIFEFARAEVRDAFSRAVIDAVAERFPDAIGRAEGAA